VQDSVDINVSLTVTLFNVSLASLVFVAVIWYVSVSPKLIVPDQSSSALSVRVFSIPIAGALKAIYTIGETPNINIRVKRISIRYFFFIELPS
jgi:hypothetical protein